MTDKERQRELIAEDEVCNPVIPFQEVTHKKREFTVGVLAIRGFEAAYNEFNTTFQDYLTATAGQQFDPPITFRMEPLNFLTLFSSADQATVDFIYLNPSAYSCVESEYEAHSLASQVSRRNINGAVYHLKKFGGVIATLANRTDIQTIYDLKDKRIAAASISGLGSGQMQFKQMVDNGMNYLQDPEQLVFTSNQGLVVQGLLSGDFDVGFVRTDQLERSKDVDGNPVDLSMFKVIDAKPGLNIDGEPFPFESSTELYPEWNIASLKHVPSDVTREVQKAMMDIGDYGVIGSSIYQCYDEHNQTYCDAQNLTYFHSPIRCGSTKEKALLAIDAMEKGKFSGWTTTLSYMQLRSMQEATGFIEMEPETKIWRCIRSAELYDAISCPAGFSKKSKEEVDNGCEEFGLECKEGFQCVCRPCESPYEFLCVDSVQIGDKCVDLAIFIPCIFIPLVLLVGLLVHFYLRHKRWQADSAWVIEPKELEFGQPPISIGRGSFGMVVLAEYRGTQVAVKRVIPPLGSTGNKSSVFDQEYFVNLRADESGSFLFDVENPGMMSIAPVAKKATKKVHRNFQTAPEGAFGTIKMPRNRRKIGMTCWETNNSANLLHEKLKQEFVKEIRHLVKLRHPCVTTVMGAVMPSKRSEPMLVMEYMSHGSLFDVLQDEAITLKPEQILAILQDIAQGLRFLHAARPKVIHGDLKSHNILIDSNFMAKVTDFGLSAKTTTAAVGTPYWMAPELLTREATNNAKTDVYSFGIIIYEIYSGRPPYEWEDYEAVIRDVCDPNIQKRPMPPINCPPKVALLMKDCLKHNPAERPASDQLDLQLKVELKVNERTNRLETLNRELEEANNKIASASAMQLQHFACMSHEIRTPLNCIIGLSSLLQESELTAMQKESIDMIVNSGQLLRTIVDDILDYSKLESGNAETLIQRVNLQETLDAVVHLIKKNKVTNEKQLKLRANYDLFLPQFVNTDSRRIQQILFNLLGNAIKFSKERQTVEFGVEILDSRVLRFTVKDYGKGIEEKDYKKIFEPFRQTNTGLTNTEGGTGLGLAITKKLVLALDGQISVQSVVGEWTEFTVDFPFSNVPFDANDISFKLRKTKVFLVDDPDTDDVKKAGEILAKYQIDYSVLPSMKDVVQSISLIEGETHVCICQEDFYDQAIGCSIQKSRKCALMTFGPNFSVEKSPKHFRSLAETFPSVLARTLWLFVRQLTGDISDVDGSIRSMVNFTVPWSTMKILIAEDNTVNQKVLTRILQMLEVEDVTIVGNGEEAVKRESQEQFDLILMDMQMPVMDGVEACRLINKREGGHAKAKIVFVTAHVSDSFKQRCIQNGAIGYLPKPCTKDGVKDVLRHAIGHDKMFSPTKLDGSLRSQGSGSRTMCTAEVIKE